MSANRRQGRKVRRPGKKPAAAPPPGTAEALERARDCLRAGRAADARALVETALLSDPGDPHAHHLAGLVALREGRTADAEQHLGRAVASVPENPEFHLNYGVALDHLGRVDDAVGHYETAISLDPGAPQAFANLGFALRRRDDYLGALEAFNRALALDAGHTGAQLGLASVLGGIRSNAHDPKLEAALLRAFSSPLGNYAELAGAAAHQLELKYGLASNPAQAGGEAIAGDPLFAAYLSKCVNTHVGLELFLTRLRRRLVLAAEDGLSADTFETVALLGVQCFMNEYVFFQDADETTAREGLIRRLEKALAGGAGVGRLRETALLVCMYGPLSAVRGAEKLAAAEAAELGPGFGRLVRLTLLDHLEEKALLEGIESMGEITDATSKAVRAQYEENPYPRWLHAPAQQPVTLGSLFAGMFPHVRPPAFAGPLDILIAGSGTGQHVAHAARAHPDARILAIDFSKASIAYAMRMMAELGIANVRFLHADILDAAGLGENFDMIQSVGVLHHMKDPLRGWRVLTGLLRPGGVLKIGLYSERGRVGVRECRRLIAAEDVGTAAPDIARFRRRLISDPPRGDFSSILETADFYSTSMCRDLLFHVQEHHTTPARLKRDLAELGLEFIGFERFEDAGITGAYLDMFPDDPAAADLDNWEAFEDAQGDLIDMYVFWCRKPDAAAFGGSNRSQPGRGFINRGSS